MKKTLNFLFSAITLLMLNSCGGSHEAKMVGTWKVSDVQTDFNEDEVTPQMLSQVVEMQKQTYFRIVDDSTMVIISNNNTHEAKWLFDEESNEIIYFFEGMEGNPNILGKLKDNNSLVNESETPLGAMTIIYTKEK